MRKSIYFLGSKEIGYECLKLLINFSKKGDFQIKKVFTNDRNIYPESPLISELCDINNIAYEKSFNDSCDKEEVDIIYSVQYHEILDKDSLELSKSKSINLHMAPLPEYRGCNQFSHAILNDEKQFGTTIHEMSRKIDAGKILYERRFYIPKNIFVDQLYDLTKKYSFDIFQQSILDILNGQINTIKGVSTFGRSQNYYSRESIKPYKIIDSKWDLQKQLNVFRAIFFPPFELPLLKVDDKLIKIDKKWYYQKVIHLFDEKN